MKAFLISLFLSLPLLSYSQDILGKWQLVKQSTCMDDELTTDSETEGELVDAMQSMAGSTPQVIHFKEKGNAVESTKIINRRKNYNSNALLYKFTGTSLHILDKKSQTIIESFTVEKLTADSLIISNASRVCETRVFVKLPK